MVDFSDPDQDSLLWWDLMAEYPELAEGLEEFGNDPEAGVIAAVGILTMLKLRIWQDQPNTSPVDQLPPAHCTDDSPPPGASA